MTNPNPTIPALHQSEAVSAPDTLPSSPAAADRADSEDNSSLLNVLNTPDASDTSDAEELSITDAAMDAADDAIAENPAPPVPDTLPAPSEQTLLQELAPLRTQYPRMDLPAVIASDAFREFGESVGWDSRELTARLPQLIEASRALAQAVEPPVSRVTAAAASHRRPLLSPGQQKELAAWNRDYPAYRMTELEYFNALGK